MNGLNELELLLSIEEEERKRERERLKNYANRQEYYKTHFFDYVLDKFGIRKETMIWSLNPEYQNHKWDGDKDPFQKVIDSIIAGKWTGVTSGTGTGKTFFGALIVFWFLDNFPKSLIITTAPKREQLKLHIWREIELLFPKFGRGDLLSSLRLKMMPDKDYWLAVGFVAGVKATEESSTKAQGFHAEHMLIICEETPGIPDPILTALEITSTGVHNLILAFGNPDHSKDNLAKFCNRPDVTAVRISGFDHPNVVLKNSDFIPGAQTVMGLERIRTKWGETNPMYLSRARGIAPTSSPESLIHSEWCYRAVEIRRIYEDSNGNIDLKKIRGYDALGVDCANSIDGDEASICRGKGNILIEIESYNTPDAGEFGRRDVYQKMKDYHVSDKLVGVDGIGIGASTVSALKERGKKIVSLIGSDSPIYIHGQEERFNNLRSQMWWQARQDLFDGEIGITDDVDLIADLVTPKWTVRNGKIIVESKDEIKKRLGRSPNKGDSFVYWNWVREKQYKPVVGKSEIM